MSKRIIATFLYTQASKPKLVQHSEVQTRAQRSQLTSCQCTFGAGKKDQEVKGEIMLGDEFQFSAGD